MELKSAEMGTVLRGRLGISFDHLEFEMSLRYPGGNVG